MIYYLCIQSTYTAIEVALFGDTKMLALAREDKIRASKNLVPLVAYILDQAGIPFTQLSFIAVNQGPGPFTNLRVAIATANGLSFAHKMPLIGIDSLKAFLEEYSSTAGENKNTLALFNAFNNDVYFAFHQSGAELLTGYKTIDTLLPQIHEHVHEKPVMCIGNGVTMYEQKIKDLLGTVAIIPNPLPTHVSLEYLASQALDRWQKKERLSAQLLPLYVKQAL
jgi:tRNA threonylcarbamoyladenosine biosynthesis protein TsaB